MEWFFKLKIKVSKYHSRVTLQKSTKKFANDLQTWQKKSFFLLEEKLWIFFMQKNNHSYVSYLHFNFTILLILIALPANYIKAIIFIFHDSALFVWRTRSLFPACFYILVQRSPYSRNSRNYHLSSWCIVFSLFLYLQSLKINQLAQFKHSRECRESHNNLTIKSHLVPFNHPADTT